MKTEYAIFNPLTGLYERTNTYDDAVVIAAKIAADLYFSHTHQGPVAQITVTEQGTEIWKAPDGSPIVSPAEIAAQLEASERHRLSFKNAQEIPVTTLG